MESCYLALILENVIRHAVPFGPGSDIFASLTCVRIARILTSNQLGTWTLSSRVLSPASFLHRLPITPAHQTTKTFAANHLASGCYQPSLLFRPELPNHFYHEADAAYLVRPERIGEPALNNS